MRQLSVFILITVKYEANIFSIFIVIFQIFSLRSQRKIPHYCQNTKRYIEVLHKINLCLVISNSIEYKMLFSVYVIHEIKIFLVKML